MRRYWFDATAFDTAWFRARLEESIKAAGPRYTPEIHVDLPIAQELEAFGRTEEFFDDVKSRARNIRNRLREMIYLFKLPEAKLDGPVSELKTHVDHILSELGQITAQPVGCLPFKRIATDICAAETLAGEIGQILRDNERECAAKRAEAAGKPSAWAYGDHVNTAYKGFRHSVYALASELGNTREALDHAGDVAGSSLALLKGATGTGKTHLLCDIAKRRLEAGRPTVLLMGQRFLSNEAPCTQALQQLDLNGISAEEFVGALESAAQTAGCRGLLVIDALNEGSGPLIWRTQLSAFLAHLDRSPWVAVLLAVRSSYEDVVVPQEIRDRAISMTHHGFADHEYDATRTFFLHYGLELPLRRCSGPSFEIHYS